MARVIWKGSISFGLVHVPVGLYSAEQQDELHLSMVDRRDLSPVGYQRISKRTGEEVPWSEVARAYEYQEGEYVILEEEDLRRANIEATQTVDIVGFVSSADIPLLYYEKPYYLEPLKRGEKGYALLREALQRTGRVGLAKVVLRTRQHLAALVPMGNILVLELLRYAHEVRSAEGLKIPGDDLDALDITKREIDMAQRLIEDMEEPWQPEQYRDEYREDLLRLAEEKARAGEISELETAEKEKKPRKAEVIDLMSLLKQSVEEKEKGSKGKKTPARRQTKATTKTKTRKKGESGAKKQGRKRA